jgi:hypothetical protein
MEEARGILSCCGLTGVHDFQDYDLADDITGIVERSEDKGFLIAATSCYQEHAVKLLKKSKFKVLATFINPDTSNKITLWGLAINQPKPRKKAKKATKQK